MTKPISSDQAISIQPDPWPQDVSDVSQPVPAVPTPPEGSQGQEDTARVAKRPNGSVTGDQGIAWMNGEGPDPWLAQDALLEAARAYRRVCEAYEPGRPGVVLAINDARRALCAAALAASEAK